MADTKISALTSVASIAGTEEYAVNESGTTKKATGTQQAVFSEARSQQGVRCSHASGQTITTATWTLLSWDTEDWKVGDSAIHSTVSNNSRMIAQVAGEYLAFGLIEFDTDNTDYILQMQVRINGASNAVLRVPAISSVNTTTRVNVPFAVVQLSASDYIDLRVQHSKGSDLDVLSAESFFGMYLLGR